MGNLPCTLLLWNAMFKIYIIKVRRYFYCLDWSCHSFNVLFCLGFILVVNNTAKLFIICAIRTAQTWYDPYWPLNASHKLDIWSILALKHIPRTDKWYILALKYTLQTDMWSILALKLHILSIFRRYFYCLDWSCHSFNLLFCLGFILVVNNTAKLFIICAIRTDIFTSTLWDVFEGQNG
jgi:hypothetical protein